MSRLQKVFDMAFADVYPHYVNKVERKGRTIAELHQVICWLTGYSEKSLQAQIKKRSSFREFFANATMHQNAHLITGSICGVKIEEIEDQLMKKIRYLDKLVDELAKGKKIEKVLR